MEWQRVPADIESAGDLIALHSSASRFVSHGATPASVSQASASNARALPVPSLPTMPRFTGQVQATSTDAGVEIVEHVGLLATSEPSLSMASLATPSEAASSTSQNSKKRRDGPRILPILEADKRANLAPTVFRANNTTAPVQSMPRLADDKPNSNAFFLGLAKIAKPIKAHLLIKNGKKDDICALLHHQCFSTFGRLVVKRPTPPTLLRSFVRAMEKRCERVTKPGVHSPSHNRDDGEDYSEADQMARDLMKEQENSKAEAAQRRNKEFQEKNAIVRASDYLEPPPPSATQAAATAAGKLSRYGPKVKKRTPRERSEDDIFEPSDDEEVDDEEQTKKTKKTRTFKDGAQKIKEGREDGKVMDNKIFSLLDGISGKKKRRGEKRHKKKTRKAFFSEKYKALKDLKDCLDSGCIDSDEYATKKQKINNYYALPEEND